MLLSASISTPSTSAPWALLLVGGLIVGAGLLWASMRLPLRWLFAACLGLSILQGFGPLGYNTVALLFTVSLLPGVVLRTWTRSPNAWAVTLAALAAWQAVSVLWSFKFGSAAYGVLVSLALLTCFLLAQRLLVHDRVGFGIAVIAASPLVVLQAGMVITFRILPSVEEWYLRLPIARYLTEPGVDVIFSGGHQNVLDPDKAGGFLLNGNIASLLLVLFACVYAITALLRQFKRVSWAIAVLCVVGAMGTGSKTPLILGAAVPFVVLIYVLAVRRVRLALITAAIGVAGIGIGFVTINLVKPEILSESIRTLSERVTLWGLVADKVPEHWFLGMGFGNWREFMVDRVLSNPQMIGDPSLRVVPPHNLFAQAWVDAGLVSLLLTLVLALFPIVQGARAIWESRTDSLRSPKVLIPVVAVLATLWVLLHGMTDTTLFSGDNHTIPWYAVVVAAAGFGTRRFTADATKEVGAARGRGGSSVE